MAFTINGCLMAMIGVDDKLANVELQKLALKIKKQRSALFF
jgi:ribosomal protein S6